MSHRMTPAGLQYIKKTHDIALDIGSGIRNRIPDAGLRCQIDYHIKAVFLEQAVDQRLIGQIPPDESPADSGLLFASSSIAARRYSLMDTS